MPYSVVSYEGGELVECKGEAKENLTNNQGRKSIRGTIKGFTDASQRRLKRWLAKVNKKFVPLFITVTYPVERKLTKEETKKHLHRFMKRLGRRYPGITAVWRLEMTARGQFHYHFLVYGIRLMSKLSAAGREHNQEIFQWVRKNWHETTDAEGEWRKTVTSVEPMRNKRKISSYVAKYMSKREIDEYLNLEAGRYWGIYNREAFKGMIKPVETVVNRSQWMRAKKVMMGYAEKKGYGEKMQWAVISFMTGSLSMSLPFWQRAAIQQIIT